MPKAIVLLSGGLDSTTTLAVAKAQGFDVYALSVDYGQRHRVELERAERIAEGDGRRGAPDGAARPARSAGRR